MIDFSKVKARVKELTQGNKVGVTGENTKIYQDLIAEGQRLVEKAYEEKSFINRTYNLADSYGSCLFVDGKEYPNSRYYLHNLKQARAPYKYAGEEVYGREAVARFFDNFDKAQSKGRIMLVVVAAAPYARVLEDGISYGLRHNYKVLAGINTRLEELKRFYGGDVRTMIGQ